MFHIIRGVIVNVNEEENVVVIVIVQTTQGWTILIVAMAEIIGFVFLSVVVVQSLLKKVMIMTMNEYPSFLDSYFRLLSLF